MTNKIDKGSLYIFAFGAICAVLMLVGNNVYDHGFVEGLKIAWLDFGKFLVVVFFIFLFSAIGTALSYWKKERNK